MPRGIKKSTRKSKSKRTGTKAKADKMKMDPMWGAAPKRARGGKRKRTSRK